MVEYALLDKKTTLRVRRCWGGSRQIGPRTVGPNLPLFQGGQLGPGQLGPGAQLSGAQFAGAQLSGAQLSGAQFA